MNARNFRHSGDRTFKDSEPAPVIQTTATWSRYTQLYDDYQDTAAEGLLTTPLGWSHAGAWAHVQGDFEDAIFELLPCSGLGTEILPPGDTRTELSRVTNALICLHDWLRLYREIIRQPPPLGLLKIEQTLRERLEVLNRMHPQTAHQRDTHSAK